MATSPRKTATKRRASSKTTVRSGGGGLTKSRKLSWKFAAPLIAIVALVGGYTVFRSFAAEPVITPQNGRLLVRDEATSPYYFLYDTATDTKAALDWALPFGSKSLTATDGSSYGPDLVLNKISPNGKRVFGIERTRSSATDTGTFKLVSFNLLDGSDRKVLVDKTLAAAAGSVKENFRGMDLSTDGNKIYFYTQYWLPSPDPNNDGSGYVKLYSVNVDGSNYKIEGERVGGNMLGVTNTGDIIASGVVCPCPSLVKMSSSPIVRENMNLDGASYDYLTSPTPSKIDGRLLYWNELTKKNYVTNTAGGVIEIEDAADRYNKVWSPDGKMAVLGTDGGGFIIVDTLTGKTFKKITATLRVITWQPAPPEEAPIDSKKPEEPAPTPDPEPEDPPVDSKKPEEETPAPPPAPTAYAEPASKLVIPNTPYILRTKTSTGPAILIRASAYGTGQYVRLSDKAAVTSFLQTQKDLGKSVKTCVSHLPVNSSNAKLVIKRLNSTSQMISVPRSPAYGDLCTTAIPVTSTMVTNPNLTTVSATGYDVTIDMITLRAE